MPHEYLEVSFFNLKTMEFHYVIDHGVTEKPYRLWIDHIKDGFATRTYVNLEAVNSYSISTEVTK